MNPHILIIEDDFRIQDILKDFLAKAGYQVTVANDGIEGVYFFENLEPTPDLIILDVMMPDLDGWSVCQRIRRNSLVPIIMLTAKGDEEDELKAFELMADDFMKKPFSPSVLVARVKALLAKRDYQMALLQGDRGKKAPEEPQELSFNEITINNRSRRLTIQSRSVELTQKEYDIVWYLAKQAGRPVSRDDLLNQVWGYEFIGDTRIVDSHIKKIRQSLGEYAFIITTAFGIGYKFEVIE